MTTRTRLARSAAPALLVLATVPPATVTLNAVGAAPAAAIDASRGTPGYCPDANGVTVVVDFQELGGATIIRCAPGEQSTGLAALKNAGIQVTGTARWGEAFVCRIEGKPGPQSEPCIDTPPANAYWSYWYAPNGGTWQYSQFGATSRTPPLGSFEGWSFAKDKTATTNPPPRISPVRPAAPGTSPPHSSAPSQPQSGSGQGQAGGVPGGAGAAGGSGRSGATTRPGPGGGAEAPGGAPGRPAAPGSAGAGHAAGPAATGSAGAAVPDPAAGSPTGAGTAPGAVAASSESPEWTGGQELKAAEDSGGGVPLATITGFGLVTALVAGAALTARRRRRPSGGSA